jgi:uncharacterized Zn finger protein
MSRNQQPPQQPQINVDLSQADDITCENCGNYTFNEVMLMKRLSALLSPTGKDAVIPIPTFACNACGYINRQFLPVKMGSPDEEQENKKIEGSKPSLVLEK